MENNYLCICFDGIFASFLWSRNDALAVDIIRFGWPNQWV